MLGRWCGGQEPSAQLGVAGPGHADVECARDGGQRGGSSADRGAPEPAADLAVCLAIGSAAKGLQLKKNTVVFGEVGLSGEVRHAPHADKRLAEAKKLGFDGAIGPLVKSGNTAKAAKLAGLYGVSDVRGALNKFLEKD